MSRKLQALLERRQTGEGRIRVAEWCKEPDSL